MFTGYVPFGIVGDPARNALASRWALSHATAWAGVVKFALAGAQTISEATASSSATGASVVLILSLAAVEGDLRAVDDVVAGVGVYCHAVRVLPRAKIA